MAGQPPGGSVDPPPTHFALSRGARIAYQDFGRASPAVVAIPPMAQNIEVAWEWPSVHAMLERFGSFCRWIHFDKRGSGASDRRSHVPGIDERVEDLRAVMDHAGVERAFLYGASEGGPTCLLFAATYPDRVDGLILHGTGPFTSPQDLSDAERADLRRRYEDFADLWGTDTSLVVDHFAPSLVDDADFRRWHQRYERLAADRESLVELFEISLDVDVSEVLPTIDAPTLVLHRRDDPIIPLEWGRRIGDGVPGAELIVLPGNDHFGYAGDQGWLDDLERFVTGSDVSPSSSSAKPMGQVTAIRTLGEFVVEVDGEVVPTSAWGSHKARMLCKRLVAARGWPVLREELCDLLWPDEVAVERLGPRLSVQLSHVRRVLGGGVVADRRTVALDLEAVTTDLEVVLGSNDPTTIVDSYGGAFLATDAYDDWTMAPRQAARSAFLDAARRVAHAALAEEDLSRAVTIAERMIAADRFDETGHELAVRASPTTAAARRAHTRWRDVMAELGVDVPPFDPRR